MTWLGLYPSTGEKVGRSNLRLTSDVSNKTPHALWSEMMKRSWWHIVKHVLFNIHSPSLLYVGRCWCQRKGVQTNLTEEEIQEAIRIAAERAYRTWGE